MFEIVVTLFLATQTMTMTFPESYGELECRETAKLVASHVVEGVRGIVRCQERVWQPA